MTTICKGMNMSCMGNICNKRHSETSIFSVIGTLMLYAVLSSLITALKNIA